MCPWPFFSLAAFCFWVFFHQVWRGWRRLREWTRWNVKCSSETSSRHITFSALSLALQHWPFLSLSLFLFLSLSLFLFLSLSFSKLFFASQNILDWLKFNNNKSKMLRFELMHFFSSFDDDDKLNLVPGLLTQSLTVAGNGLLSFISFQQPLSHLSLSPSH